MRSADVKRAGFLAASAVAATVAAVVTLPSPTTAAALKGVHQTGWIVQPNLLVWVRRYYVLDVFEDDSYGAGPHLTTAHAVTAKMFHVAHFDQIAARLERAALSELDRYLRTGEGGINTVRFNDGDVLPCSIDQFA